MAMSIIDPILRLSIAPCCRQTLISAGAIKIDRFWARNGYFSAGGEALSTIFSRILPF
jgi:hypothetical protein